MKSILSFRIVCLLALIVFSMQNLTAQTWGFRAGYGQSGNTNGLADVGRAICTDASGNIYVTGKISDDLTGNIVSLGGAGLISAGDDDGFVAKFGPNGIPQWSFRFGGTVFTDIGYAIATDGTSVYVAGAVNGAMTVGTSPVSYPAAGTGIDGVVMKLNASTGAVTWVTRFGGANSDDAQSIAVDPTGNVYISGTFRTRTANPTATFGSFTRTVQGNTTSYTSDLFVAQLNSSGVFTWVSTGGISGSNDNINGSGICYVPTLSEVIVTGSLRTAMGGSTNATYSTTSPASSVTLINSGNSIVNEDFCLLELNAGNGAFLSGSSVGGVDGNEAGLGITYDAYTDNVFFVGYFGSSTISFPGNPALANASAPHENAMYGRYSPSTNTYVWVKDADNNTPASAADYARSITTNNAGRIFITGSFRNTIAFAPGFTAAASGALSDIFVVGLIANTGMVEYVLKGTGTSATADDFGYGIAASSDGRVTITGQYASSITFGNLPALNSLSGREDILLAQYNDKPTITTAPVAANVCQGQPASFSVTALGFNSYIWQESTEPTFLTGVVPISNGPIYSGINTANLTISDITGLSGRYYRVSVSNAVGLTTSAGVQLIQQAPTLSGSSTVTQNANTKNNLYYGPGCGIVAKILPAGGGTAITGSVTSQVWVEGTVPTVLSKPFVQRHYQITPAVNPATATATVTLYFTQAEFDNFNAAPGSTLKLPANSGDAAGKANLRIGKYGGTSSDGTGLPGSYSTGGLLVDPPDNQIVWNATFNRWEVTFDVTGFSGFIVQTDQVLLPVNLISFSAQLDNNDVLLKWQTSSETETDHFEVERSLDGKNFTAIGRRNALNGSSVANYDLTDASASSLNKGKLYYRLKTISLAGKEEFSRIVIVYPDKKGRLITGLLPNPFVHELNLGINAPRNGQLILTVTDMTGRVVLNQNTAITKGFSTWQIQDADQLARGIYTLTVNFDGLISTHKIIRQ